MEFSRQEDWSGLPCPPPGDLLHAGFKPESPTLQADSLSSEPPRYLWTWGNKVGWEMGPHSYRITQGEDWDSHCLYLGAVSCFSESLMSFPLKRFPPNPKSLVRFCPWVLSESHEGSPSGRTFALRFLGTRSKVIGARIQAWILLLPEPKTVCRTFTMVGYPQCGQCSFHPQGYLCDNSSHLPSAQGSFS